MGHTTPVFKSLLFIYKSLSSFKLYLLRFSASYFFGLVICFLCFSLHYASFPYQFYLHLCLMFLYLLFFCDDQHGGCTWHPKESESVERFQVLYFSINFGVRDHFYITVCKEDIQKSHIRQCQGQISRIALYTMQILNVGCFLPYCTRGQLSWLLLTHFPPARCPFIVL